MGGNWAAVNSVDGAKPTHVARTTGRDVSSALFIESLSVRGSLSRHASRRLGGQRHATTPGRFSDPVLQLNMVADKCQRRWCIQVGKRSDGQGLAEVKKKKFSDGISGSCRVFYCVE